MFEYIASGVCVLLCLIIAFGILIVSKRSDNRSVFAKDPSRYDAELLPLADSLSVELDGMTIQSAMQHIKKTRPSIRVFNLPKNYDVNKFWDSNKGLAIIFPGTLTEKVTTYEVGRDDTFVSNYVASRVPRE